MCGITGWFAPAGSAIDAEKFHQQTAALRHRGPDGAGLVLFSGASSYFVAGFELPEIRSDWPLHPAAALGHTRLAIIDQAGGVQPMTDETRRHWLVYNGEIYNFRELRAQLEAQGRRFATRSDTEVLLQALAQWGLGALERLEGMFAFAWWDAQEQRLHLVRDRLGIKPLVYTCGPRGLVFGSEIKALLPALPGVPHLSMEGLRDYLHLQYVPGPGTIYEGIEQLAPGHVLTWQPDWAAPRVASWWELPEAETPRRKLADAAEELDGLLAQVCREHLIADVSLGVCLSGGMDSAAVLAYGQAAAPEPLSALHIAFAGMEGTNYNEEAASRGTAEYLRADLHAVTVDHGLLDQLPLLARKLDQPLANQSSFPVAALYAAARTMLGRKVMLSGDGGDEVFGGYNRYGRIMRAHKPPWLARVLSGEAGGAARTPARQMRAYLKESSNIPRLETELLFRPECAPAHPLQPLSRRYRLPLGRDPLTQWQALDLQTYLAGNNLNKVDALSMALGLEIRVPLLDRRIVEFAFSLPARLRHDGKRGKLVLHEALRRRLPDEILNRPKLGFKLPIKAWFVGTGKSGPISTLLEPGQPVWRLLRRERAAEWWQACTAGKTSYLKRMWSLLFLNEWLKQHPSD